MIYTSSSIQLPSLKIDKAAPGAAFRDQIVDVVTSRKKMSELYFAGLRINWPRLYDLWRGTWTGRFHPHKNNVHIPLMFSAVWADAARKAATSLNDYPIVNFLGYGPDDMSTARKRESLINAQMKDDEIFKKQVDFIVSSDLYGKAVMQIGWKRKEEARIIEYIDRMPISGRTVKTIKKGTITSFDGPVSEPIDLLDCYPQPGVRYLSDMKWFIRRYFLDLDDVRYLAAQGIFDKAEVARLEREGGVNWMTTDQQSMVRRFAVRAGMDDESIRWMDKYLRNIEILEMWGVVPSELAPDGVLSRVITVGAHKYLFRNKPNPFWHNKLPFVDYGPTPDPHYFFGPGKAETIEKLQITGNRYINQSLDAADLILDPMWFYDRASNLNTRNLYARPGRFIPVDGSPNQVIGSFQISEALRALSAADSKIAQIRDFIQMGSGIVDDAVQGLPGSDRQTAREFIGRREAAGSRLLLESRLYEEMCLEPMANMFVALDKQFLETPVEVLILGDNSKYDPVTQKQIPTTREHLTDYDLVPNYAARAMGATSGLSRQMKMDRLIQLLQALSSPLGQAALGSINAVNFFRGIFKEFEVPNINEIFTTNPQLGQLAQQASGGQGVQNVPTSGQILQGGSPLGLPATPVEGAANLTGTMPRNIVPPT